MNAPRPTTPLSPPRSAAHWSDPFVLAALLIAAYCCLRSSALDNIELTLVLVGIVMLYIVPVEYWRSPARRQPRPEIPFALTFERSTVKCVGVFAGLSLVLLAWSFVNEYTRDDYKPLFEAMPYVLPFVPFAVILCVFLTESRMGPDEDQPWHMGLVMLGRQKDADWVIVRDGLLAWLVKGFFLPLNICAAVHLLPSFRGKEASLLTATWPNVIDMADHMIFMLLVLTIIPGYLFSARILGTQIKKVDHSWFGWMVTMFCYPPLNRGSGSGWFVYTPVGNGTPWVDWFGASGAASYSVGIALLFFYLVHYWGESICGLRSSHLTNRGIITSGPFRYCKHPVYVVKCLAWGLTFLPFVSHHSLRGNISFSLGFLVFCVVYAMRGWVEERVLSTDPDYVPYALWMDQHSLFRFIGKRFPICSFAWRLQRWQKNGANI